MIKTDIQTNVMVLGHYFKQQTGGTCHQLDIYFRMSGYFLVRPSAKYEYYENCGPQNFVLFLDVFQEILKIMYGHVR